MLSSAVLAFSIVSILSCLIAKTISICLLFLGCFKKYTFAEPQVSPEENPQLGFSTIELNFNPFICLQFFVNFALRKSETEIGSAEEQPTRVNFFTSTKC